MTFDLKPASAASKPELYAQLPQQARAVFSGEPDPIANAANLAALLYHGLPELNWAGLDSPLPNRFDEDDRRGLEALAQAWLEGSNHG